MTASASSASTASGQHWDEVYAAKGADRVSWFQPEPTLSLEFVDDLDLDPASPIVDVGGGASTLVDKLLERGFTDVTVLDISAEALGIAQARLGPRADAVRWEIADLLRWEPQRSFALWHDRAVFHFLTNPDDQAHYRELATASITVGGYLLVATFATDGPAYCSGLPVARYSAAELAHAFGPAFSTVATRGEHHHTPSGAEQPFIWLLMRRTGSSE